MTTTELPPSGSVPSASEGDLTLAVNVADVSFEHQLTFGDQSRASAVGQFPSLEKGSFLAIHRAKGFYLRAALHCKADASSRWNNRAATSCDRLAGRASLAAKPLAKYESSSEQSLANARCRPTGGCNSTPLATRD